MDKKDKTPLITRTAFSCPHCGAYTTQFWHKLYAVSYSEDGRVPSIPNENMLKEFEDGPPEDPILKEDLIKWVKKMILGKPFFENSHKDHYRRPYVNNCNLSECYNCKEISVWVKDKIVYPNVKIEISPNPDLPEKIKQLFEESREIVDSSPKGAAALLRLCVQYLCIELGESGRNIDKDIGNLVSKGMNPMVQQALDVVRVIGNESVHPGSIDLNDNKDIAMQLFDLINLICEQMISHPKKVEALYAELPENKLNGIERRNAEAKREK